MNTLTDIRTLEQCRDTAILDLAPEGGTGPYMTCLPDIWPGTGSWIVVAQPKRRPSAKMLIEADVGTTTSIRQHDYTLIEDDQTSATTRSTLIILLEENARAGDRRTFAALAEAIDWSTRQPGELTTAIDLALSLEMATLAIKLAQVGARLFPEDERTQRAAQVLATPIARITHLPRTKGLDASMAWLDEHANQYRGQWVAVREGQLLGAAESLEDLEAVIGQGKDAINTIVTKVL